MSISFKHLNMFYEILCVPLHASKRNTKYGHTLFAFYIL